MYDSQNSKAGSEEEYSEEELELTTIQPNADAKKQQRYQRCEAIVSRLHLLVKFLAEPINQPNPFKLWINGAGEQHKVAIDAINAKLVQTLTKIGTRKNKNYLVVFSTAITGCKQGDKSFKGLLQNDPTRMMRLLMRHKTIRNFFTDKRIKKLEAASTDWNTIYGELDVNPHKNPTINLQSDNDLYMFNSNIPSILPPLAKRTLTLNKDAKIRGTSPVTIKRVEGEKDFEHIEFINTLWISRAKELPIEEKQVSMANNKVTLFSSKGSAKIKHKHYIAAVKKHNLQAYENTHGNNNGCLPPVSTEEIIKHLNHP